MRETKKIPVVPWNRNPDAHFQILLVSIILLIFIIFAYVKMAAWQAVWVFINIAFGYAVLAKKDVRKKVRDIYLGILEVRVWGIAFLNLLLVIAASSLMTFLSPSSGDGGGNPFVSSIFLVITLIPIMPLFADAETTLFQGLVIRFFMRKRVVECKDCGTKGIPATPCRKCGTYLDGDRLTGPLLWTAVFISSGIFAAAHMLLLWSMFPAILFVGGVVLGTAYVRKGHMFTAKVHFIYNMVILALLILIYTLAELGVMN